MKLWFDNGYRARVIARVKNEEEAIAVINKFCSDRNYKIYYIRKWKEKHPRHEVTKPHYVYDVGSHTQFFCLEIGNDLSNNI